MAEHDTTTSSGDNITSSTSSQSVAEKTSITIASLSGNDTFSLQITTHKLDGKNYLQWAQSVKIVICGHDKLGYITGELPAPNPTDLTYKTWLAENFIVLAWLINSMDPKISRRYLWFKTAKEVWDAARRMYRECFSDFRDPFETEGDEAWL